MCTLHSVRPCCQLFRTALGAPGEGSEICDVVYMCESELWSLTLSQVMLPPSVAADVRTPHPNCTSSTMLGGEKAVLSVGQHTTVTCRALVTRDGSHVCARKRM